MEDGRDLTHQVRHRGSPERLPRDTNNVYVFRIPFRYSLLIRDRRSEPARRASPPGGRL